MMNPKALAIALLAASFAPSIAVGQDTTPTTPAPLTKPVLTVLTPTADTRLRLKSKAGDIRGLAPLDLPGSFEGKFNVTVTGPGVARTRGTIEVPSRSGSAVTLVSERRAPSLELLVRSASLPGFPDIVTGRSQRGLLLSVAAAGGLASAMRAHLMYRDRLSEFGDYAADRARDERLIRNDWARYAAATYVVSAVDYWLRPRLEIDEVAAGRVVISAPTVSRTAIVWRSMIVPGAGQEFANHQWRGAGWLGAALAAGAGFVVADGMVEHDQTRADWAEVAIDSAGPSERALRIREFERRRRDVQSSEDLRRGFRYALIGAYVANVIDALFVPAGSPATVGSKRVSTSAIVGPDGPQFAATVRF